MYRALGAPPLTLTVDFELPAGWVRLPPSGAGPSGMLRRDPFEALARQVVKAGAVIKELTGITSQYMRNIASGAPDALGMALLIQAPSREEHTFANFVVFAASAPPAGAAGGTAVEQMMELAARRSSESESDHRVEPVELPWGRGARSTWTRPRPNESGVKEFIGYWVDPDGIDIVISIVGEISAGQTTAPDRIASDIDSLARSVRLSPG